MVIALPDEKGKSDVGRGDVIQAWLGRADVLASDRGWGKVRLCVNSFHMFGGK